MVPVLGSRGRSGCGVFVLAVAGRAGVAGGRDGAGEIVEVAIVILSIGVPGITLSARFIASSAFWKFG